MGLSHRSSRGAALRLWLRAPASLPADHINRPVKSKLLQLYLPPYSPEFNPIENAFAKLKTMLRKAAARTVESLWNAIGCVIDTFTPSECANYFAAAGYDAD
jgi:transposase